MLNIRQPITRGAVHDAVTRCTREGRCYSLVMLLGGPAALAENFHELLEAGHPDQDHAQRLARLAACYRLPAWQAAELRRFLDAVLTRLEG